MLCLLEYENCEWCVVCRVSCMCAAIFKMNIRICSTLFFGFFACLVPSFFAFVQIILVLRQTFITFFTWQPNDTQQTVFKAIILLIFDNARRRIRREQKKIIRKSTTNRIITRGIKIIKKNRATHRMENEKNITILRTTYAHIQCHTRHLYLYNITFSYRVVFCM